MSTALILRKGISALLNTAVIDILARNTGTDTVALKGRYISAWGNALGFDVHNMRRPYLSLDIQILKSQNIV